MLLLASGFGAAQTAGAQTDSPTLSIADATVAEGNATFRELLFPVTLSRALTFDVSASFKTRDITTANNDYAPQSAGQIVIKAGQIRANILIRVLGDKIEEKDESFLVQLGAPKRCAISDSDGIGSIKDDDYAGQITINDVSTTELNSGQKIVRLEVKFSQAPLHEIEVRYQTKDDSAKAANSDYIPQAGTLVFKPGRTALTLSLEVVGDLAVENDERFYVQINASHLPIAKNNGFVTVQNDDFKPNLSGKIVFARFYEVFIVNADGSHLTQLTRTSALESSPQLSRDGTHIVAERYDGTHTLWLMNADGTGGRVLPRITERMNAPSFSPDGKTILFSSGIDTPGAAMDLWTMNLTGTISKRLTNNEVSTDSDRYSRFAPDGRTILFERRDWTANTFTFWLISADGSGLKRLSQFSGYTPCFSPDGKKIAFARWDDQSRAINVWLMNSDGSNPQRLTHVSQSDRHSQPIQASSPCWSPDGSALAFVRYISYPSYQDQLFVINFNGSGMTPVVAAGGPPSWSIGSVPAPVRAKTAAPPAAPSPSAPSS